MWAQQRHFSLGIRPVWSEFLMCTRWVVKDPRFLHADSKVSDQTGWMPGLIWVFAGCNGHFVGFVMLQLKRVFIFSAGSLRLKGCPLISPTESIYKDATRTYNFSYFIKNIWMIWATSWENLFMPYANNKGADQPAHPRSLISAFVVRCLDSIIPLLVKAEISRH